MFKFSSISNPIFKELLDLKLIKKKNIIKISESTRDKKIKVFKDKKSDIIFLEKYLGAVNYFSSFKSAKKPSYSLVRLKNKKIIKSLHLKDDKRRFNLYKNYLVNKNILDFGCSWGGFLSLLKNISKNCYGIELRKQCIEHVKRKLKFINISNNFNQMEKKFDIITMFCVLEHIPYQVQTLKKLRKKLRKKGKLIIEVPSAQDFLIALDDLPEFKKFTFWSEHLILHTEKSLKKALVAAGFKKIRVRHLQRYGYTNHLGWFLTRKPGGHEYFKKYEDRKLDNIYRNFLVKRKQADTITAIAGY